MNMNMMVIKGSDSLSGCLPFFDGVWWCGNGEVYGAVVYGISVIGGHMYQRRVVRYMKWLKCTETCTRERLSGTWLGLNVRGHVPEMGCRVYGWSEMCGVVCQK